ncbi:translation initiation factor IF-2 [Pseudonocardia sp. C8]|uniref:translation initiation factor IF-2 n=1 Tax=Pseudonocardia sp. C8 TaxID=2762759 RepID=UPI001642D792|nr:translation initiation factor IF-2 [Pseudonocardia sp. C8]
MAGKSRTKNDRQVRDRIAELAAARDRLDAEEAERRRREDEAFERYARADADAVQVVAERDRTLADLEAQARRVRDDADARLGEIEQRQREILAELHRGGRKADDLAAMFGLPVKRVRTLLRQARPPSGSAEPAATPQAGAGSDPAYPAIPVADTETTVAAPPAERASA